MDAKWNWTSRNGFIRFLRWHDANVIALVPGDVAISSCWMLLIKWYHKQAWMFAHGLMSVSNNMFAIYFELNLYVIHPRITKFLFKMCSSQGSRHKVIQGSVSQTVGEGTSLGRPSWVTTKKHYLIIDCLKQSIRPQKCAFDKSHFISLWRLIDWKPTPT